jgi:ankyrin repeat protein
MIKKVLMVLGIFSSTALGCDIWEAVENNDAQRIEEIISLEGNANVFFTSSGSTPQHLAACWNKVAALATLIRLRANVNAATYRVCGRDDKGDTPLYKAASRGNVDCIKLLCDAGADVNVKNQSGVMPLHVAAIRRHTEAVKLLLHYGADPYQKVWTWGYLTATQAAVHSGSRECIEALRLWELRNTTKP